MFASAVMPAKLSALSPSAAKEGNLASEMASETETETATAETASDVDIVEIARCNIAALCTAEAPILKTPRQKFYNDGFFILDLSCDSDICSALALQMEKDAMQPDKHCNRGPGRTCVNDWCNIYKPQWDNVFKMILQCPIITSLLKEVGTDMFYDAGGDYIEGYSDDTGEPGERNPCKWHVDCPYYFQWVIVSVLITDVSPSQGPLLIKSWSSKKSDVVSVSGRRGLCIVRDASAWHCGSANKLQEPRPMPSFRFASKAAAPKGRPLGDLLSELSP